MMKKDVPQEDEESDDEDPELAKSHFEVAIGKCNFCLQFADEERIRTLINFGYRDDYVRFSVVENEANYCATGYYLLGIDQNY